MQTSRDAARIRSLRGGLFMIGPPPSPLPRSQFMPLPEPSDEFPATQDVYNDPMLFSFCS